MKKTRGFKARRQTILIGAMVLLTIFLTSFVSAEWFSFDNVKQYNSTTQTIKIVNTFGLGSDIAEIQLKTPLEVVVPVGYQKVAEFQVTNYEDYNSAFDKMEFYNIKDNMKSTIRTFDYKVKVNQSYEVDDYGKLVCGKELNGTDICNSDIIGKHTEHKEEWIPLGKVDFVKGEVLTIGIFTTVYLYDNVEWILTAYGKELTEWASFIQSSGTKTYQDIGGVNYTTLTFTSNGTFNHTGAGNLNVSILVIAGGGGGGGGNYNGAGGGAGGLIYNNSFDIIPSNYNIVIGNGGTGGVTSGNSSQGQNSSFSFSNGTKIKDTMGGGKAGQFDAGNDGGSGGGGSYGSGAGSTPGGLGVAGQGNRGGNYVYALDIGGGGGGAGSTGIDANGSGGAGLSYSINGTSICYAGGGGGADQLTGRLGSATCGGGAGSTGTGINGVTNTGGGRGGAERTGTATGGTGGSGIVIIRYLTSDAEILFIPSVTLNSPINYFNTTNPAITFNTTATDNQQITNVTLYIDGVVNETDTSNVNGTYLFNKTLGEGKHNWSILAYNNNSVSNQSSTFDLWINTTPSVTLTAPVNYANLTYKRIYFNATINSVYDIKNVTFYLNGTANETITTGVNGSYNILKNMGEGYYNWSISSCSSLNACNQSSTRFLTVDSTPPTIFISSGNGTQTFGQLATNHTVNYTITDLNLDTCTFQYNGVNKTINCTSGFSNSTNFTLIYGIYNAIIYANDSVGFVTSYSFNWSYEFFYLSESYTSSLLEGTNNTFKINLVSSNALTVGNLSYNGTSNFGTINNIGNNYTITKSMFSPLVSTDSNLSFFWNIIKSNGISYAFESHNQTVLNFNIDNCSVNTINILNFSIKDEESQANLNATGDNVSIKIDLTLSTISGTTITTLYRLYNQSTPAPVCINSSLGTGSYLIDALVEYQASNYAHEFYNIQKYNLNGTINPLQNITLYDLLSADNQPFRITYRDKSYLPVSNALVQINRKYVEEGIFKIVEVPKTDSYGETVGNLVVNNVIYTFNIVKDGVLLDSFPNVRVVCQTPTISDCKLDLNSFSSTSTIFNFTDDNDFSYTLITNRTLRTTTALFTIPSGNISTIVLNVSTTDALGTSICSQSITTSGSSSLICTYPAPIGNVSLVAKLYRDGVLVGSGNINLNPSPKDMFNGFSVILALFVLLTLIGVSISDSPITMVILFMVGVILLTALNLVANTGFVFGATILYLIIAIVLIIIKGAKRQI